MKNLGIKYGALAAISTLLVSCAGAQQSSAPAPKLPPRQMENLGRGVVALKQNDGKIFVSWRLLGTDDPNLAFNVYRSAGGKAVRLNAAPLVGPTHFMDASADASQPTSYFVRAVAGGQEGAPSQPFTFAANAAARPYLSLPPERPPATRQTTLRSAIWMATANMKSFCTRRDVAKTTRRPAKPTRRFCRLTNSTAPCCGRLI